MQTKSSNILRAESFDIRNPRVSVDSVSNDVLILESVDGKSHIELLGDSDTARRLAESVEITADGHDLSIQVNRKNRGFREIFGSNSSELKFILRLPSESVLKIKTVSADIEIDHSLRQLEVVSVSGDIDILKNPSTSAHVKTVSGDITAHTFSGCEYSLKSVSGDIIVHVAPGLEVDVDGKSISGDMESEIPLSSDGDSTTAGLGLVKINTSTVSGDFSLARS